MLSDRLNRCVNKRSRLMLQSLSTIKFSGEELNHTLNASNKPSQFLTLEFSNRNYLMLEERISLYGQTLSNRISSNSLHQQRLHGNLRFRTIPYLHSHASFLMWLRKQIYLRSNFNNVPFRGDVDMTGIIEISIASSQSVINPEKIFSLWDEEG